MTRRSLFAVLTAAGGLPVVAKEIEAPEALIAAPRPLIAPEEWIAPPHYAALTELEFELVRRCDSGRNEVGKLLEPGRTYDIRLHFREEQIVLGVDSLVLSGSIAWQTEAGERWRYHLQQAESVPLVLLPQVLRRTESALARCC